MKHIFSPISSPIKRMVDGRTNTENSSHYQIPGIIIYGHSKLDKCRDSVDLFICVSYILT